VSSSRRKSSLFVSVMCDLAYAGMFAHWATGSWPCSCRDDSRLISVARVSESHA
jgi:hypothetical protein